MKKVTCFFIILAMLFSDNPPLFSQSSFDLDSYRTYLQQNQNMSSTNLLKSYTSEAKYYANVTSGFIGNEYSYLDSIELKFKLTDAEMQLLKQNNFVVTKRLSYRNMGSSLMEIYNRDLPVFVTTDAILHALHCSYDNILMVIEYMILEPNLIKLLNQLHQNFPQLAEKYQSFPELQPALTDVDIYLTMALSLIKGSEQVPYLAGSATINELFESIKEETPASLPLFCERGRALDFSQFIPRGHYTENLVEYFQAMIWLGTIDFFLTCPPQNPFEENWSDAEIKRMQIGAFLLNELIEFAQVRNYLDENEKILQFLIGESDNLTPAEYAAILTDLNIQSADELLNDSNYDKLCVALTEAPQAQQKILSTIMIMDPDNPQPDQLPVSYRLLGQRFALDSYVFYNVVYPNIIYQSRKIWRPMPNPLDIAFSLGNNNAAQLLKNELDTYHYSSQLAALRYLVDSYDNSFWENSLYNTWLNSIRQLNPADDISDLPLFMQTAAWQQQKLNTQLASWSQLRHDNILYVKQSYTGAAGCSFPYSFVEPYPEFYRNIADYAKRANEFFTDDIESCNNIYGIIDYMNFLETTMDQLADIAQKELNREPIDEAETRFLQYMLYESGSTMCGDPPYGGWYVSLFYISDDLFSDDFVVADVHTQPTDQSGLPVGKILHVGTGKMNLGVFLAYSPVDANQPMAFVGPCLSYHEMIENDYMRLTDDIWSAYFLDELEDYTYFQEAIPTRPAWVNLYLATSGGELLPPGPTISGTAYTDVSEPLTAVPATLFTAVNYPNPFNPVTTIRYTLPAAAQVQIRIFDILGREIEFLFDDEQIAGTHQLQWSAPTISSGIYFCRVQAGENIKTLKLVLMK